MAFSYRKFINGLRIKPKTTLANSEKGDLEVSDVTNKLNFHNGSVNSPVVTELTLDSIVTASVTNIANANISPTAGIVYSKLNLTDSIENADVSSVADIAISKLAGSNPNRIVATNAGSNRLGEVAAISPAHVLYTDANGLPLGEATLAKSRGGTGADNSSVTFPSSGTLVTEAGIQSLTNKDYDGGTASNTSRLTVPQASLSALQALTRKEGTLGYASDVDRLYVDDGSTLKAVGAGSGSINYITNPDAEASTAGWATYADAAAAVPVDGTGGSPNVTFTRSTSGPLEGLGSFLFTKDAVNRQGQGVSTDFTIAPADQGKQLAISFVAQTDTNYVAGDLRAYVYDVTNASMYEVVGRDLQKADLSNGAQFTGIIQTPINSTSLRFILHVATVNSAAYVVKLDRFAISPSEVAFAPAVTDWETVTVTGSWIANTTYLARRRRLGDSEEYNVTVTCSGAPTSATLTLTLPTGRTIDTAKLSGTNNDAQAVGAGIAVDTGTASYPVQVVYNSATTVKANVINAASTFAALAATTQAVPITFGNTDTVHLRFIVPIVGFGSNIQVGGYDGRTVAARYTGTAMSGSFTAASDLVYNTRVIDTHGAYNTATGAFTAPVAGPYRVSGICTLGATTTANSSLIQTQVFKNGVLFARLGADLAQLTTAGYTFNQSPGSTIVDCVTGDTISFRVNTTGTISAQAFNNTASLNFIDIELIPGRSTLAAADTVAARFTYSQSVTHNINTTIPLTVATSTVGSGILSGNNIVAPIAGRYRVSVNGTATYGTGVGFTAEAQFISSGLDGTLVARTIGVTPAGFAASPGLTNSQTFRMLAGETLRFDIYHFNSASTASTMTGSISFERIGNY